jgi:hypothetical protein
VRGGGVEMRGEVMGGKETRLSDGRVADEVRCGVRRDSRRRDNMR